MPGAVLDAATGARFPSYYSGVVPANCIVQVEGESFTGQWLEGGWGKFGQALLPLRGGSSRAVLTLNPF